MISPEPGARPQQVSHANASDWQIGTLKKVKQALEEYYHNISIKELPSPESLQGELLSKEFTFVLAARPGTTFVQFSGRENGADLRVQTFNIGPAPKVPASYSQTYEVIVEYITYLIERQG